jgi:hypothetical protein
MAGLPLTKVNCFLLYKQHLLPETYSDDVVRIASDIGGLHATGVREPYLALLARSRNFKSEMLTEQLVKQRNLIKMRCMRGTLYLLTGEMVQIAFPATNPFVEDLSRRFALFRGASPDQETVDLILKTIGDSQTTLAGIKKKLGNVPGLPAIINYLCDIALLARVPYGDWQSRNYHYAKFCMYHPGLDLKKYDEFEGLKLLIRRYMRAFAPADIEDIAWWIGAKKSRVKAAFGALGGELKEVEIQDLPGKYFLPEQELKPLEEINIQPGVNLLPDLDPYLMAYRLRTRYLTPELFNYIYDKGGNATSSILVDGKIAGVWDFSQGLKYYFFEEPGRQVMQNVEAEMRRVGELLGKSEVNIERVYSMTPLNKRTAGGFMSPLRRI